ncbi:MAG: hypothetical protein EOP86_04790 [Verrucomicrobiaceae bacterium]|nr:MAG: hypothetical protein EOP86_04790 [Verrucomicrobiaceae bacterium]
MGKPQGAVLKNENFPRINEQAGLWWLHAGKQQENTKTQLLRVTTEKPVRDSCLPTISDSFLLQYAAGGFIFEAASARIDANWNYS